MRISRIKSRSDRPIPYFDNGEISVVASLYVYTFDGSFIFILLCGLRWDKDVRFGDHYDF